MTESSAPKLPIMPQTVTREEYLEAVQPLCTLLGVEPLEVYDIHVGAGAIRISGVVREEGDLSECPTATRVPSVYRQPGDAREFVELAWIATVEVR